MSTIKNPIYLAYIILNLVVSLPIYVFYNQKLGVLSFLVSCLYLLIYIALNLFFLVAKLLNWSKITSVYLGFFGFKNILILAFIVAMYKLDYLDTTFAYTICIVYYLIYTSIMAKFVLSRINVNED